MDVDAPGGDERGKGSGERPDDRVVPFRRPPEDVAPPLEPPTRDRPASVDLLAFALDAIHTGIEKADVDPDAARDRLAVKSERVFFRRFWFKVGKPARAKILRFKAAKGVTDGEITLLWWMDAIDTSGPEVRTTPSRTNYVQGYVLLILLGLMLLMVFSATIFRPTTGVALLIRFAVEAALLIAWCLALVLYVRPYTICKRLEREEQQAQDGQAS